jgi:hypothetical protein
VLLSLIVRTDGSWKVMEKWIKDGSIRNSVPAIQDGPRSAVERKDVHGLKFAAKMQLEAVDVLEQYFKRGFSVEHFHIVTRVSASAKIVLMKGRHP